MTDRRPARRALLARWRRSDGGASAVEFALVAPILAFVLLAGVDLALAISERMAMDHALRAGAQTALAQDPGDSGVLQVIRDTAEQNFPAADGGLDPEVALSATRFCACAEDPDYAVSCGTVCSGSTPTVIFYRMTGDKTYAGWIMPAFEVDRTMQVQIR